MRPPRDDVDATDVDSAATFVVQSSVAKTYGTFSIDAAGAWSYTLDDNNAAVQALTPASTLHELVTVATADGTDAGDRHHDQRRQRHHRDRDGRCDGPGPGGNRYFLHDSGGAGPSLKYGGAAVAPGQFAGWTILARRRRRAATKSPGGSAPTSSWCGTPTATATSRATPRRSRRAPTCRSRSPSSSSSRT